MWCPGALIILCAWVTWAVWRLLRLFLGKEQPPVWVRVLEVLLTPFGFGWLLWKLWHFEGWDVPELGAPAVVEPRWSVSGLATEPSPALILTDTPLGPLPDYFHPAAIHPAATARIFRDTGEVDLAHIAEWKEAVRGRGYDVRTLAAGTQAESWEIRVRTIPSRASVWA